ncbi:MAG: hypothetical protein JWO50_773 [Candidatus Kaiserbacteria bacterium]|nr:hypothetical protein [Candidatus Kaiserbacteria bacterium]
MHDDEKEDDKIVDVSDDLLDGLGDADAFVDEEEDPEEGVTDDGYDPFGAERDRV